MLKEYAKVCKYDISAKKNLSTFTDAAEVSGWAIEYLQWAAAVEMITGKPNEDGKTYRLDPKGGGHQSRVFSYADAFCQKYTD
ncbi:MAG: hypothetical protein MR430_05235 [Lachnospiraceae bacterium]|nr:hypothetical protein [Lachnospiraceae bacterium]